MSNIQPEDLEKYQKHYSEKGLFAKIGKVFRKAGEKVIYHALLLYYVLVDKNTPFHHKATIVGALGYFIFPMDIVPDFLPIAGFADDLAAIMACIKAVNANITPEIRDKASSLAHDYYKNLGSKDSKKH
ncbi:MAG: DUF1232 domain-containing protein [Bacteroidales bacterium]|nr:DUF1232 domain-containing protein [Bacteroidales bacterium]